MSQLPVIGQRVRTVWGGPTMIVQTILNYSDAIVVRWTDDGIWYTATLPLHCVQRVS